MVPVDSSVMLELVSRCTQLSLDSISWNLPFQLLKINSTELYDFILARTYRARTQLIFNSYGRHSIFSVRKSLCLALQGSKFDPGTKFKYTNEH